MPGQVAAVRNLRSDRLNGFERVAIGVVQLHDRPRDRLIRSGFPQIRGRDVLRFEERVAENLVEVRDEPGVALGSEALQIQGIELGELEEERRCQRPLIVLDQVQIRRGNPEPLREIDLAQAVTPAKGADFGTEFRVRHANPPGKLYCIHYFTD